MRLACDLPDALSSPLRAEDGSLKGLGAGSALLLAVAYGVVLAMLPLMAFRDRANYLRYATYSLDILNRNLDAANPLAVIANEPVWLLINAGVDLLLEPEQTLRLLIFLPATTVSYLLLRAAPRQWPWLLFFLLVPQLLTLHITHLRQGAGLAFFLYGWFGNTRARRWLFMGLSPFIHASFFFALILHVLTRVLLRLRLGADVRSLAYFFAAVTFGIGLGTIASFVGARQAGIYEFSAGEISGIGFLFWFLVLCLFFAEGKNLLRDHALAVAGTIFYLGTYFFVEVTARIFATVVAIVLLAGVNLTGWRRWVFLAAMIMWGGMQWTTRLSREGSAF